MMESKIRDCIPPKAIVNHKFHEIRYPEIHIVDWKNFDKGKGRGIEVCDRKPEEIKSVCLFNENNVNVLVDAFGENALPLATKKEGYASQCECVATPVPHSSGNWFLCVETKYAGKVAAFDIKNDYPKKMVSQIISTVDYFRNRGVIEKDKLVYAIISFPKLIHDFNSELFSWVDGEWSAENLILNHKIRIKGCNSAEIISPQKIKHI